MESATVASDKGSTTLHVGAQRVSVSDCGGQNHVETHGRASYSRSCVFEMCVSL